MAKLEELGRDDTVQVLLAGCSLYRIMTAEESKDQIQTNVKDDMNN